MKITIRNLQKRIPIYPARIKKPILKAISREGPGGLGEITICFVTDNEIRRLNARYHKVNAPTDVLAFSMGRAPNNKGCLADIIISADTAVRNAKLFKTTPAFELKLYALHGMLHLLGYKDKSLKDAVVMRKKETAYVNS